MDDSGFLLGSVLCDHFCAGEHEWLLIKLSTSSMRPCILTKVVGKGDVRNFKVLLLSMGQASIALLYPLTSECHFQVSGNDCLSTVFFWLCKALRGRCDRYVRLFTQPMGTMRHKPKWVSAERGRTFSITFSLCFGPRHTVAWVSPPNSWLFYVCQWLHCSSSLGIGCRWGLASFGFAHFTWQTAGLFCISWALSLLPGKLEVMGTVKYLHACMPRWDLLAGRWQLL